MLEDPALELPYADESDRGRALAELLSACADLEEWRSAAQHPITLGSAQRDALAVGLVGGDSVEMKLQRWVSLFEDEISAVLETRNRVVHGLRLSDKELRGAVWLARHLLGLVGPGTPA